MQGASINRRYIAVPSFALYPPNPRHGAPFLRNIGRHI